MFKLNVASGQGTSDAETQTMDDDEIVVMDTTPPANPTKTRVYPDPQEAVYKARMRKMYKSFLNKLPTRSSSAPNREPRKRPPRSAKEKSSS